MAIRFEDKGREGKPDKKEVGGKTYVAEQPAPTSSDPPGEPPAASRRKPARGKPSPARPA